MITATTPTGVRLQYNDANYAEVWGTDCMLLAKAKNDGWIAIVPKSWAIEIVKPCRTYSIVDGDALRQAAELLEAKPQTSGEQDGYLIRIKRAIAKYDIRRRGFR